MNLPAEVEALVLAELAKRVQARTAAAKAVIGGNYAPGRRETFRSPVDDTKLGLVYRTDPDPEWRVVDEPALHAHLVNDESYWEPVAEVLLPSGEVALMSPVDELYQIVAEHAPHLARSATVHLREDVVAELLAESKRVGEPAAPGIEKVKPEGALTVRPDKAAGDAISRMVEAGILTWDGRPALEQQGRCRMTEHDLTGCTCWPCTDPAYGAPGFSHCAACCYGTGIAEYDHDCPTAEHRDLARRQFGGPATTGGAA